jgi:Ni,Fe-hydrogenase III small subunit
LLPGGAPRPEAVLDGVVRAAQLLAEKRRAARSERRRARRKENA